MIEKSIDYRVIGKVYRFVTVSLPLVVNILSILFCRQNLDARFIFNGKNDSMRHKFRILVVSTVINVEAGANYSS